MNKRQLTLKKVYTVSKKHNAPRLWLQHLVCEAAGLTPGAELYVQVDEINKQITIRNIPFDEQSEIYEVSVSSRISRTSGKPRPLVDTSGAKFSSILCVQEKIEISVYRHGQHAEIIVRPLRFRLFKSDTFELSDERIRLLTICSGSGIGASMFVDSQYYTAVQEVEIEEDCAEVIKEKGDQWRFLTIRELRRIFQIPGWFSFPDHIPMSRIYEMIGQSVCGRVIRAFANEISSLFFRRHARVKKNIEQIAITKDQNGQIGFAF